MKTSLTEALERLASGRNLTRDEARAAIGTIVSGEASDIHVAALLTALRVKGETPDELAGAIDAVLERMTPWAAPHCPERVLDTCGTGGDGANTVNVSTATAIVVAACGVPVAKHGNRSASGNSGSAEVLSVLGVEIEAPISTLELCLREVGLTFLFAPRFHPALRFAAPVRKQLPYRTLFNLVGPLANPARPAYQLVGVAGGPQADLMAQVLARRGMARAAVVTGSDGLDEVTLGGQTRVCWVESGTVTHSVWEAHDFGLPAVTKSDLRVSGPSESADRIGELLAGRDGPTRLAVLANAAAALLIVGQVDTLRAGVEQAAQAIDDGKARHLLDRWIELSRKPAAESL